MPRIGTVLKAIYEEYGEINLVKTENEGEVKNPIAYITCILNKKFHERYFEEFYDMRQVC